MYKDVASDIAIILHKIIKYEFETKEKFWQRLGQIIEGKKEEKLLCITFFFRSYAPISNININIWCNNAISRIFKKYKVLET